VRAGRVASRLWRNVWRRGPRECWPYLRYIDPGGIAKFWYQGEAVPAYRVVWLLTHGKIPDGKVAMSCPILKDCCNPEHVGIGTRKDVAERSRWKRGRKPKPPKEKKVRKLTDEQVRQIFLSEEGATIVANQYGVSQTLVSLIRHRKKYQRITNGMERDSNVPRAF
jgi:hypothetical protein